MSDPVPTPPPHEPWTQLYWREFTRDGLEDVDHPADKNFLSAHFVDFFGKWLQQKTKGRPNAWIQSFDELIRVFWEDTATYETHVFMVADGSFVEKRPWDWFSPGARLVAVVHLPDKTAFDTKPDEMTLCIVGSSRLTSEGSFLQVISWDGRSCRYYQRDTIKEDGVEYGFWNYFGNSLDAFGPNAYLGPFNGHVNGSVIMKEIHDPWTHWYDPTSPGAFVASLTEDNKKTFKDAPYLTQKGLNVLSALTKGPDKLEAIIKNGVMNWFETRVVNDFFTDDSKSTLKPSPSNIHRWAAHLFLTTTINMGTATMHDGQIFDIPLNHFYDNETFSAPGMGFLLSGVPGLSDFKPSISLDEYATVLDTLGLCMVQDYTIDPERGERRDDPPEGYFELPLSSLGGDRRGREPEDNYVGFRLLADSSEGHAQRPFHFLHSSIEDAEGIRKIQTLKPQGRGKFLGLFSQPTFLAVMMIDFWNPVYSWKRGVLMQYIPLETAWDETTKKYDLEARFIQNVTNSSYVRSGLTDSPEYQFLQLLQVPLSEHQQVIGNYLSAVQSRLEKTSEVEKANGTRIPAIIDYFRLAESRRRIYRPLPLDEFGASMPYAKKMPFGSRILEMRPDGTVGQIDQRGQTFLDEWTASLSGFNPIIIPPVGFGDIGPLAIASVPNSSGPIRISALPRPSLLALPCQGKLRTGTTTGKLLSNPGCPYSKSSRPRPVHLIKPKQANTGFKTLSLAANSAPSSSSSIPNWEDDIVPLITKPCWITPEDRAIKKGKIWITKMEDYSQGAWSLTSYEDVVQRAVSIYRHLRSKSMPITSDPADYWPEESLETFRAWANAGFPRNAKDVTIPKMAIPRPIDPSPTYRVRRDIMSMSVKELAVYQAKLDDALRCQELGSKWQELGLLHAEWCLHYQEATFPWHRAYLLHVETLLDGYPIPYWNGYSANSCKADSPFAGIPRVFFEKTYIHPTTGLIHPNPLRFALALNGQSKDGNPNHQSVVRHPTLEAGPSGVTPKKWSEKIDLFKLYHKQIAHALSQATYTSSHTAQNFGIPWTNILTFGEKQDDSLYPYRFDFDGLFEQVHDNFHGWVGPDMADNTYTAFDPIFLSYHANMDRLAGIFMDKNPTNMYTSRFPLQPFVEGQVRKGLRDGRLDVDYTENRKWAFVTLGDMVKDVRSLGYMYGPPVDPDYIPGQGCDDSSSVASASNGRDGEDIVPPVQRFEATGGRAITLPTLTASVDTVEGTCAKASGTAAEKKYDANKKKTPYIVFMGVGCTSKSYRIDVFTPNATSLAPSPGENPDFIGQITRLGMGPAGDVTLKNQSSRKCRVPEASRVLVAAGFEDKLPSPGSDAGVAQVKLVVTDLETEEVVDKQVYEKMPGFEARVVWLAT